jgi:hypothetical protein
MKKEVTHFRIKVAKPLSMSKAKKLVHVSNMPEGSSVYKTIAYDDKDDVFEYLKDLGCSPESVSKLSLRT